MKKDPVKGHATEATAANTEVAGRTSKQSKGIADIVTGKTQKKENATGGPGTSTPRGHKGKAKPVKTREDALDDALEETFPASDPVSIVPAKPEKPKP